MSLFSNVAPRCLADCSRCSSDEYIVSACSTHADTVCGACDASCASCSGNGTLRCLSCAPGYIAVDLQLYGGAPSTNSCVVHERCSYSGWGPYSVCSAPCGGGVSSRTRRLLNYWPCFNAQNSQDFAACNTAACSTCGVQWLMCRCA